MHALFPRALVLAAAVLISGAPGQKEPDRRLNTDPAGSALSRNSQIAASGSSVYVVWVDRRNDDGPVGFPAGINDIYFNRSLDGGATWLNSDVRLDTDLPGAGNSWFPVIAASGSAVYVA